MSTRALMLLRQELNAISSVLRNGLGRHVDTVNPDALETYLMVGFFWSILETGLTLLQVLYSGSFLYSATILFTKLSILSLYRRLFPKKSVQQTSYVVAIIVAVWFVVANTVGALLCIPVTKVWRPSTPGGCIDLASFYYGLQIPNIVTDVAILVIPVKTIWSLPLPKVERISLQGIFLFGVLLVHSSQRLLSFSANLGH